MGAALGSSACLSKSDGGGTGGGRRKEEMMDGQEDHGRLENCDQAGGSGRK